MISNRSYSCFQPKLKAEVDNDELRLVLNSSYHDHVKTELNNCFIEEVICVV